ncbi:damage-inducible protein YebG, partial [Salmonella enterica subsp. enterica serovar Infantis]
KEVLSTLLKTGKLPSPQAVETAAASKTNKQAA